MSNSALATSMNTTTAASAVRTKWETQLLEKAKGLLVGNRFATTKVMGRGEAGTLRINKLLRIAKKTTTDSEGVLYNYSDAKQLSTNYIDLTPNTWGDSFGFTDDVTIEAFITDEDNQKEIANQMARSMDYQVMKTIGTQSLRHRIDKDATYQVSGTADSGSTTTLVDDALTQIDDHWNGGFLTITNPEGPNYDATQKVSDFVASSDTLTTAAFNHAHTTSSNYRLTVGTGITAADKLTIQGLLDVSALHRKLETDKFAGNMYRCFMDAAQERDLWDDTTFLTSATYDNSKRLENYRVGRWLDIEFLVSSEMYREDVDGTENQSTGVVYIAPVFGAKSYAVVDWNTPGVGDFGVQFHTVDTPDSNNLRMGAKWISWKSKFASKVLRSTSMIGLMTGATDLNLVI